MEDKEYVNVSNIIPFITLDGRKFFINKSRLEHMADSFIKQLALDYLVGKDLQMIDNFIFIDEHSCIIDKVIQYSIYDTDNTNQIIEDNLNKYGILNSYDKICNLLLELDFVDKSMINDSFVDYLKNYICKYKIDITNFQFTISYRKIDNYETLELHKSSLYHAIKDTVNKTRIVMIFNHYNIPIGIITYISEYDKIVKEQHAYILYHGPIDSLKKFDYNYGEFINSKFIIIIS